MHSHAAPSSGVTNVYVDGFNLFYGALKGTPYKWLDLAALSRILLPRDQIGVIRYFTARVGARADNPDQHFRQDVYLRALQADPKITIHFGMFKTTEVRARLVHPPVGGPRTALVYKTEEKGTDVTLASFMLLDAFKRACSTAVLITNDSDLAEPVRIARQELGIRVGVINPHRAWKRSVDLQCDFFKQIRPTAIARAQLPNPVRSATGKIHKPEAW